MKNIFSNKQFLGILFAIIAFALITLVYFTPILEGKRIKQHDIEMYKGMSQEINEFREETGEQSLWTNSMFGGMPAWNIGVQQNSNLMTYVQKIIGLGFPSPIMSVFISMLGFFILLLVLDCKIWISFIGALAYGFTSYLFIVMGAGHNSKAVAMAYMAPVIAGIIMTYKGKYLWGAVLTAISLALEIRAGHIQITYYLFMIVLIMVIAEFVETIKTKKYLDFFSLGDSENLPCFIAFKFNDDETIDQVVYKLSNDSEQAAYASLKTIISLITKTESLILPEYKQTDAVFRNVKMDIESYVLRKGVVKGVGKIFRIKEGIASLLSIQK